MATKRDTAQQLDTPAGALADDISAQPRMVIAGGRGKVGKSTLLRWAIEQSIARGGEPVIADADRTNPTLAAFFPSALRPPSAENDDVRMWLNDLADTQIERRTTVYLDLGGGDLTLKQWARDLDIGQFLQKHGITPVLIHVLGSDLDDLTYLRDLETVFTPRHTMIVLNEGMTPTGRHPLTAFEPVLRHEVFLAAHGRGAVTVRMPRLTCMQDVDLRRQSYADAEAGRPGGGHPGLKPTAQQLVAMWQRGMVTEFADVASWLT